MMNGCYESDINHGFCLQTGCTYGDFVLCDSYSPLNYMKINSSFVKNDTWDKHELLTYVS